MTFDQVLDILEVVLPVLTTLLVAKYVNVKTPHWAQWKGRFGRIAGLVVEVVDLLRLPEIKAPKEKNDG